MVRMTTALLGILMTGLSAASGAQSLEQSGCPDYLNLEVRRLHSQKTANLCDYYKADEPLLIVNTASHCGFTRQFGGLEALYKKYQDKGLVVLGFPSNSFKQEEKSEAGTAAVCYENYGVTFPMFEHVEVKGEQAHPLFKYLAEQTTEPAWNFNKYLLVDGKVNHFGSKEDPLGSALEKAIATASSD